jgi:hypothetical protein
MAVAIRARPGVRSHGGVIFNEDRCAPPLLWDAEAMQFTTPEANSCLRRE